MDMPKYPVVNFIVRGKIIFSGDPPASLPSPSFLNVGVSDTALMDTSAIPVGGVEMEISASYNAGIPLTYEIHAHTTENSGFMPDAYSLSGTIAVGWKPGTDGQWLKVGDYLNDTHHTVPVEPDVAVYDVDLELIHYNH